MYVLEIQQRYDLSRDALSKILDSIFDIYPPHDTDMTIWKDIKRAR